MSICDVPVIATVCASVGEGAASLVAAPFDYLAAAVGAGAQWFVGAMWTVLDQTTLVDLTNAGYVGVYNLLFGIAVALMAIFFFAQLITAMVRREPAALSRAALGLAKAVVGSFLVLSLATLLLEVTDQLTVGVVQAAGMSMSELGTRLAALFGGLTAINLTAPGAGAIITVFLGCLTIAGTALVWFTLLVRKALVLAAIVLAPIALSGAVWDLTRAWVARWASFVVALIVSKLVVVVILLVAVVQLGAPIDLDLQSVADPLAGVVLLLAAAFSPYLVYKLVSFAGIDMYHSISAEQETKQALNRPLPVPAALPSRWPSGGGTATQGPASPSTPATEPAPAASGVSAAASGGSASPGASGAGGAAGGSAAAGGAAAAGPAAAVIVGAELIRQTADAGPRAEEAVGQAVDGQTTAAGTPPTPAPPAAPPMLTRGPAAPGDTPAPTPPPPTPPVRDEQP